MVLNYQYFAIGRINKLYLPADSTDFYIKCGDMLKCPSTQSNPNGVLVIPKKKERRHITQKDENAQRKRETGNVRQTKIRRGRMVRKEEDCEKQTRRGKAENEGKRKQQKSKRRRTKEKRL